jgi:hypothetical protein
MKLLPALKFASLTLATLPFATPCSGQDKPAAPPRPPAAPMAMPRAVALALGDRRIVVDGAVEDWPAASPLLLLDTRQVSGTALRAYLGPSDLSAQAFLAWNADDLYVAVKVKDDWHRPLGGRTQGVGEIPPADNVMLTFDPGRDTRALGRDPGRSEDREFWLADVEGEGKGRVVQWDRFRGTARWADGASLAVARDQELRVTTYETRLPWREILPAGTAPDAGAIYDLQVVVNDLDEVTDIMPQTRVGWTFGTGPRIDPGLLGSFQLLAAAQGPEIELPEFPSPPLPSEDPVPGPRYWIGLYDDLRATDPVPFTPAHGDPRAALGPERLRRLETLESHLASFPRVDFLEFQQRIHRRMSRECAGIVATGLPWFWDHVLADVRRRLEAAVPERGARVFRLPQSGWLVLSKEAKFAIDPAGYGVEHMLFDVLDFVLLTDPLDMCKRNDQLLLRMLLTGKTFVTHIAFHLPSIDAAKLTLAQPGQGYDHAGLRVSVLGDRDEQGHVPLSVGYHVRWPDGLTLVHAGTAAIAEQLPREAREVELLLLSAEHVAPVAIGHKMAAKTTILDDVLVCADRPGADARVTLDAALELQASLRPHASMLLAPGESVGVSR